MSTTPTLAWEELERDLRQQSPADWFERLQQRDGNRFNQLRLLIDRFATGGELKTLFTMAKVHGSPQPGWKIWIQRTRSFSTSYRSSTARFRRQVHPGVGHEVLEFSGSGPRQPNPTPRPVLIGLTGNAGLLMTPTPCFLAALGLLGRDLLLIRRSTLHSYYQQDGGGLREICRHLKMLLQPRYAQGLQRSQVIALGTSSGGLAALSLAQRLDLGMGVAIGAGGTPEGFLRGGAVERFHRGAQLWRAWPRPTPLVLAFPELNTSDCIGAAQLCRSWLGLHGGRAKLSGRRYHNCSHHALFFDLANQGVPVETTLPSLLRPFSHHGDSDPLATDLSCAELEQLAIREA